MKRLLFTIAVLCFVVVGGLAPDAGAAEKIGVILMHGKGGTNKSKSPVGKLEAALKSAGFMVSAPDMPWSRFRKFDRTYEQSMNEISDIVQRMRSDGATKVVVGGQSIGANAALGYGALVGDMDALLIMAPGHVPAKWANAGKFNDAVDRAKAKIDAGKGDETDGYDDVNQGKRMFWDTTAKIYHSFWSPDGNAVMKKNARRLKKSVPVLLSVGTSDGYLDRAEDEIFSAVSSNPNSVYVTPDANHKNTPIKSKDEIIKWLKSL